MLQIVKEDNKPFQVQNRLSKRNRLKEEQNKGHVIEYDFLQFTLKCSKFSHKIPSRHILVHSLLNHYHHLSTLTHAVSDWQMLRIVFLVNVFTLQHSSQHHSAKRTFSGPALRTASYAASNGPAEILSPHTIQFACRVLKCTYRTATQRRHTTTGNFRPTTVSRHRTRYKRPLSNRASGRQIRRTIKSQFQQIQRHFNGRHDRAKQKKTTSHTSNILDKLSFPA